jgi:hypothetical protein
MASPSSVNSLWMRRFGLPPASCPWRGGLAGAGIGIRRLMVSVENAHEAALADGLELHAARSLQACIEHLCG